MCTASHNPKAYTGAKLVERGAVALAATPASTTSSARSSGPRRDAPGGGAFEEVDIYEDFQRAALAFIDPEAIKPLKVVVDGGNGMAGPMVGPLLERLGLDLVTTYWEPDGEFPGHEPNPLLEENRRFIIDKVRSEDGRPRHRLGRRRRPLLLHRRHRPLRRRRLPHRAARRVGPREAAGRRHPLRHPRLPRRARRRRGVRRQSPRQPRRPRLLQAPHARRGRRLRRRGLRPLLLPRLLQRRLGHHPRPAHPRAALPPRREALRAAGAAALEVLHLGRDQLRGRRPAGQDGRDRAPLRRRPHHQARRHLRRLRRLALQRPPVEHRAAAAAEPRERRLPSRTWSAGATRCSSSSGRDPLPPDPHAVRRGPGQLLPDRGRPADAGRHRAQLRQGARRAREGAGRARAPDRGPRADRHHPPAPRPPRAGRHPRRPVGRRGGRARPARPRARGVRRPRRARRRAGRGADAAPRHPARRGDRAARRSRARSAAGAAARTSTGRCATARRSSSRTASSRSSTAPATRRPTRCSGTSSGRS